MIMGCVVLLVQLFRGGCAGVAPPNDASSAGVAQGLRGGCAPNDASSAGVAPPNDASSAGVAQGLRPQRR